MKISKRWLPSIIIPAVIAAGAVAIPMQANAVNLPDLTPQQVMLLMDGQVTGFSGTIVKTSDLGLPPLEMSSMMDEDAIAEMAEKMPEGFEDFIPTLIEQNALTEAVALVAGTHKIRVYASEVGMRVQVLDMMSQRDLIVNQNEFWIYDARKATALTGAINVEVSDTEKADLQSQLQTQLDEYAAQLQLDLSSPEAIANYLMAQIGETTTVSVGKHHRIAGRTAYQLIAQPNAANSLVESVVISVDSETGLALDLKVYSVEQDTPAFHIGFESISFATPDASMFSFTPPPGTTVETLEVPAELEAQLQAFKAEYEAKGFTNEDNAAMRAEFDARYADQPKPEMIGEGWESVIYLPAMPQDVPMELMENELFSDLMVQVPGGQVFSTPILNVLITDSGAVYAGAVTIEFLQEVAAR